MNPLRATLIQTSLYWEDKKQNLASLERKIASIDQPTDVIILPEMFSTGFSMNTSFADVMDGDTVAWMLKQAASQNTPVCGSLMMQDNGHFVNRFIWMDPSGKIQHYDKRHLFRMGNEHHHFTPGNNRIIIEHKGWKIFPVVCYDLRFPVWLRRTREFDYDVMLFVANWPERREHHWKTLLQARAIENQSYVFAVNRVGLDGHGVNHSGFSGIISPKGEWLLEMKSEEGAKMAEVSKTDLTDWRTSFPAADDADAFTLA